MAPGAPATAGVGQQLQQGTARGCMQHPTRWTAGRNKAAVKGPRQQQPSRWRARMAATPLQRVWGGEVAEEGRIAERCSDIAVRHRRHYGLVEGDGLHMHWPYSCTSGGAEGVRLSAGQLCAVRSSTGGAAELCVSSSRAVSACVGLAELMRSPRARCMSARLTAGRFSTVMSRHGVA
eukprot:TRINITY_DN12468_c0_g1_i1.p3 TRINITY_DN12468_c0_g1~~TRINITY_DN12468_c0_g1_i1.p3  ORF type:complete len:178 (+),score=24.27 TRINITY_DN12468_c0_g1_i1:473-1006(+)